MEAQLTALLNTLQKSIPKGSAFFAKVQTSIDKMQAFRQKAIEGTIPLISNYNPPGFGKKLFTIANVSVVPGPAELAKLEDPLRTRLVTVLDKALKSVLGNVSATFKQALDNMAYTKEYYALDEDKRPEKKPQFELPKGMGFLLKIMPPFEDPVIHLSSDQQQQLIEALTEHLLADYEEFSRVKEDSDKKDVNPGTLVLDYLINQITSMGTGVADLGDLMKAGAKTTWARELTVALAAEQYPNQKTKFLALNKKLVDSGYPEGLADPTVHAKLKDHDLRTKLDIKDEEYEGMVEFMHLTNYFAKAQVPFAEGRIKLVQHYIYEPMMALKAVLALADAGNPAIAQLKAEYQADIVKITKNFETQYCEGDNLRNEAIQGAKDFIQDIVISEAALCKNIMDNMVKRFGADYILHPENYGYITPAGALKPAFKAAQGEKLPEALKSNAAEQE